MIKFWLTQGPEFSKEAMPILPILAYNFSLPILNEAYTSKF